MKTSEIKIGDKVSVSYPDWDGEGVIETIFETISAGRLIYVVKFTSPDNMRGKGGGFGPNSITLINHDDDQDLADRIMELEKEIVQLMIELEQRGYKFVFKDGDEVRAEEMVSISKIYKTITKEVVLVDEAVHPLKDLG